MMKAKSDTSRYTFSRKKRYNDKSLGDPLCFSNCMWEVYLAPIKWETPEICGRVGMYVFGNSDGITGFEVYMFIRNKIC